MQENFQIVISGPATLPVPMMPLHKEFEKWRIIQVRLFESGFDWRAEAVKILAASRMPSSPRGVTSTADMAAWKAGQKG